MYSMKEKILIKATEMFLELGFKSVTMDEIASELSISKKTIYAHFKNKIDLVTETTNFMFEHISTGIEKIQEKKLNSIEELFEIKNFILKTLKNEKASPQYQLQKFFPEIHHNLKQKQLDVVNKCVTENIERGIKNGVFRKEINIPFITLIYFSGVNNIEDEDVFSPEQFTKKELLTTYLDYHIRAIATEKGLQKLQEILKTEE